jgi:tRNA A37 threonylcarbamoyladenosine dehydratase
MGAGGKTDVTSIKIDDISKSYNCPLARLIRKRLHRLGVYNGIKVVFSAQKPSEESLEFVNSENKKTTLGTISFLPNIFGLMAASAVINDLIDSQL